MEPVRNRMYLEMASGGLGMATASVLLNPLDVIKVRMQFSPTMYTGMIDCGQQSILKSGGFFRGLWFPGLSATLLRDVLNGSFRVGLYKEIERRLFPSTNDVPIAVRKVATGIVVGSTAGIWSHTDLVKTRMQIQSVTEPRYLSLRDAYSKIVKLEGIPGLYRGLGPNLLRASLITTSHVGSYDYSKQYFLFTVGMTDGILLWTACGFVSALATTTVAAPVDLVRTRVMASVKAQSVSVARTVLTEEGVRGFFRGWFPSFYRFGPHFTISWPLIEIVRTRVFKLDSF